MTKRARSIYQIRVKKGTKSEKTLPQYFTLSTARTKTSSILKKSPIGTRTKIMLVSPRLYEEHIQSNEGPRLTRIGTGHGS